MTLCIGALMRQDYGDRIALCFDTRISADAFGSETEYKFSPLSEQLCCLVAGRPGIAKELVYAYREYLAKQTLAPENLAEHLQQPILRLKRRMAESYTGRKWGLSYEEFLKSGSSYFPADYYQHHLAVIDQHKSGVELIVAGFIGEQPTLCSVRDDQVTMETTVALIGTGAYTAEPCIHAREHRAGTDWRLGVYNVFEAKKIGERSPFVGEDTRLFVVYPPEKGQTQIRFSTVTPEGENRLTKLLEEYGPKPMIRFPDFESNEFTPPRAIPVPGYPR